MPSARCLFPLVRGVDTTACNQYAHDVVSSHPFTWDDCYSIGADVFKKIMHLNKAFYLQQRIWMHYNMRVRHLTIIIRDVRENYSIRQSLAIGIKRHIFKFLELCARFMIVAISIGGAQSLSLKLAAGSLSRGATRCHGESAVHLTREWCACRESSGESPLNWKKSRKAK